MKVGKTTDDSSLGSGDFTKDLLGFFSSRQWLGIANDVPLSAAQRESHSVDWSLDRMIKLFETQINTFDERSGVIDKKLEDLDIKDLKLTWIKGDELKKFKVISEKYGFSIEHLKELLADCNRIKEELKEIGKKYGIGLKMANDYLYRLCEIEREISKTSED